MFIGMGIGYVLGLGFGFYIAALMPSNSPGGAIFLLGVMTSFSGMCFGELAQVLIKRGIRLCLK